MNLGELIFVLRTRWFYELIWINYGNRLVNMSVWRWYDMNHNKIGILITFEELIAINSERLIRHWEVYYNRN